MSSDTIYFHIACSRLFLVPVRPPARSPLAARFGGLELHFTRDNLIINAGPTKHTYSKKGIRDEKAVICDPGHGMLDYYSSLCCRAIEGNQVRRLFFPVESALHSQGYGLLV